MEKKSGTFIFISGSPGAAQIGNFLLKHKEFFVKHFLFKMKRITPQEVGKYTKMYKSFPVLKMGNEKIYGEKDIINYLNFSVNPPELEPESYDELITRKNMNFTSKNGKITFDDEDEKEDFDKELARKTAEFRKKYSGRVMEEPEPKRPNPVETPDVKEDYDDQVEQYRMKNLY